MFFKNNSTKEKIITLLSQKWPLSITELSTQDHFDVSYQYLRQCLAELVEAGIVIRKGMKYELSLPWLHQTHDFTTQALAHYKYGVRNTLLPEDATFVTVRSLEELGNFMLEALEARFLEKKDKKGFYCLLHHLWIPFTNKDKQQRLLAITDPIHVVYTQKSLLDTLLHKSCYQTHVKSIKLTATPIDYDFFVYGRATFQIYFPKELLRLMDDLYCGSANPFRKVADLFAMTYTQFSIPIVITRNKGVAEQHRQKVIKLLK